MLAVLNAVSFAAALTAIFAFRFRVRRPRWLAAYFALFAGVEILGARFLPEGALPPITAVVFFGIALLFTAGVFGLRWMERREVREAGEGAEAEAGPEEREADPYSKT